MRALLFFLTVHIYVDCNAMEQVVKSKKILPTTVEIFCALKENQPIDGILSEFLTVDKKLLRDLEATAIVMERQDEAFHIRTILANNPGLQEALKDAATKKRNLVGKEMNEKLKHKNQYQLFNFFKGGAQLGFALGLGTLIFYDSKRFITSVMSLKANMDSVKMSLCLAGLGYASISLIQAGCWKIKKAIGRKAYCEEQKNIAEQNQKIADKVDMIATLWGNPQANTLEKEGSSGSEFNSSSVYPSNLDTKKDSLIS